MSSLTWSQAIAFRLARHHLLEPAPANQMTGVVSDVCCVHAQVAASAELMIGIRVRDITRQDVRNAVWRDRTLVKTPGLRGTLHLIPAQEVPLWMAANRLRFPAERRRFAQVGINPDELDAAVRAIGDIVGSEPIGRVELEREIERRVGGWATSVNQGWMGSYKNWPMAVGWAAALGLVCYGPGDGGRSTFVRLRDWAGWRDVEPEEGGRFVLRRFLHAYGPSTEAEFARWFASEPIVVKRLFRGIADELAEVMVEGEQRWTQCTDLDSESTQAADSALLLPPFDVFVVGSHPRSQLIESGSPVARLSPGTAAGFSVLLLGGRVGGVWERHPKGKRLLIRVDAHRPLNRRQRASIEHQAVRVAQILERDCELEFGSVALRPHA